MPRDDAVSPIVAVMSLALTAMALSATVFMVARSLNDDGSGYVAPIGIVENDDAGSASVPLGQTDADWRHILLSSDKPVRFALNGAAGLASTPLVPGVAVPASPTSQTVRGGDLLDFCADGLPQQSVHIVVTYQDDDGGQVLKDLDYSLLAPCL